MLGTVTIHKGKGAQGSDGAVGGAGIGWIARYLDEARPDLVAPAGDGGALLRVSAASASTSTT
ncbi:MAG: hypothetical protein IPG04_37985 [Polyangiaceae bacterium]|nr:hypothetical protein [Polyangiaceae bacterium]